MLNTKNDTAITNMAIFIILIMLSSLNILPAKNDVIIAPSEKTDSIVLTEARDTPKSSLIGFINSDEQFEAMPIVAAITTQQAAQITHA